MVSDPKMEGEEAGSDYLEICRGPDSIDLP